MHYRTRKGDSTVQQILFLKEHRTQSRFLLHRHQEQIRLKAGGNICSTHDLGIQIPHGQSSAPRPRPPHLVREVRSQVAGTKREADHAPPHAHLLICAPSRGPRRSPTADAGAAPPPPPLLGPPRGCELSQSAQGPPPVPAS